MNFTLDTAIQVAVSAHFGQRDMAQQPYILHPLRVMHQVLDKTNNQIAAQVAVLHDAIEDSKGKVTFDSLALMGISPEAIDALMLVTKTPGVKYTEESYITMVHAIRLNPLARAVKIADLQDNLDLTRILGRREGMNEKDTARVAKYLRALNILDPR